MEKNESMLPVRVLLLCLSFSLCCSMFAIPLKMFTGKFNSSVDLDLTPLRKIETSGNGLSLASDPSGIVNFLDMVNNLQGDSGRGYYMEMLIGTPSQTVWSSHNITYSLGLLVLFIIVFIKLSMSAPRHATSRKSKQANCI